MIQVSLPHVMHCAAALLYNRKNSNLDPNIYKLGAAETKLLYTLHWILLDAAEECADSELEEGVVRDPDHYLLPVTTIELFIYLFSPLIPYLKQSDFLTSFRLENGYKIWLPLFNHVHPDIPSFSTQVKPKRDILRATRHEKRTRTFGDVFLGGNSFDKGMKSTNESIDSLRKYFIILNWILQMRLHWLKNWPVPRRRHHSKPLRRQQPLCIPQCQKKKAKKVQRRRGPTDIKIQDLTIHKSCPIHRWQRILMWPPPDASSRLNGKRRGCIGRLNF